MISLISRIKRAAIDQKMYLLPIDDNWGEPERQMWYGFCNKFGGQYSDFPTMDDQKPEFIALLDKYRDPDYTGEKIIVETQNIPDGMDLRQLLPDSLQPPKDLPKQQKPLFEAVMNENAIPKTQPLFKETPKDVVRRELQQQQTLTNKQTANKEMTIKTR